MELFVRVLLLEQFLMQHGGVVGDAFRRWLNKQLEPVLLEEEMYTESIFLNRRDGGLYLLRYMEAENMEAVYDGFVSSDCSVTELAGRVAGRLFEDTEEIRSPNVSSDYPAPRACVASRSPLTDSRVVSSDSIYFGELSGLNPRPVFSTPSSSSHRSGSFRF